MFTKPPTTKRPRTKPPTTKPRTTAAPVSTGIELAYERFLELPVAVVLLVLWVGGVALLGRAHWWHTYSSRRWWWGR